MNSLARLTGIVAGTLLALSPALAQQAMEADKFVDSIGVCTHMWYPSTPYTTNYATVKQKLIAANIRHIRDDLATDRPAGVTAWKDLAASGIKTGYIFTQQWATVATFKQFFISNNLVSTADYVEGPNEFDANKNTMPNWATVLKNYQTDLYNQIKADALTSALPVLAPSFMINAQAERTALGNISNIADYGNGHPYPGGQMPTAAQTVNDIGYISINTPGKPTILTEIGYHNATSTQDGHNPASELATSLYLPRVFFEMSSRGITRTYYYQFVDHLSDPGKTNPEAFFGLLRYDLSEKPAYIALKNLTTIMKDPGASFTPQSLNYSVSAPNSVPIRSKLYQKRDGNFYLALWRDVSVWDIPTRTDISVANVNATVTLPGLFNVTSFTPTQSATGTSLGVAVSSVTVPLGGAVKILRINRNFRIRNNSLANSFMNINTQTGKVQYGAADPGTWGSHWMLYQIGTDLYTIRSRWTGDYTNIEQYTLGYLLYGPNMETFWSAHWFVTKNANGTYTIRNRWQGTYATIANRLGYVQHTATPNVDGQWVLSEAQ
ncbi:MAG: hypothetical protein QM758_18095 [Armatimonas sp.]